LKRTPRIGSAQLIEENVKRPEVMLTPLDLKRLAGAGNILAD
jgi:hypothetical protein